MERFLENVNQRMNDFFFDVFYTISAVIFGYSLVYLYCGVVPLSLAFIVCLLIVIPLHFYLRHKNYINALKMLAISFANISIYLPSVFLSIPVNAEFYYLPALILPFILFPANEKNWIFIGSALPLFFWSLQEYNPIAWPIQAANPADFPADFFQKINVIGSFIITMFFMTRYQIYLFGFKYAAEQEIEQTKLIEQNLEEAQRIANVGNWQLDIKTQNLFWSKEQYRIFGLEGVPPEKLFKACISRVHPEDLPLLEQSIQISLKNKEPFDFEHRIIVNNEIKHMLVRGEPILDHKGDVVGVFGTGQDITERKKTEQLVAEQQLKLISTSKLASLGEMAGGIAHEINNPLSIIKSKADTIARYLKADPKQDSKISSDIELISQTSDRIAKIIRGLRSLSRNAESDPQQKVTVRFIVEDVVTLCKQRMKNQQIELRVRIETPESIYCRPAEIGQVLINLINNSADAIENLSERWIDIVASENNENIIFKIRDSGKGIPKIIADKMMDPFFTTKDVGRGTGLGLSISRGITERHNGHLYYNDLSENTEFCVVLPKFSAIQTSI